MMLLRARRSVKRALPFVAALLAACGDGRQHWDHQAARVECAGFSLVVRERVERVPFAGATFCRLTLERHDGGRVREVDFNPKAAPIYTKLYGPDDRFRTFKFPEPRPREAQERQNREWHVFADPAAFSAQEADAVAVCIDKNADTLAEAMLVPRSPDKYFRTMPERSPRFVSFVRRAYRHKDARCSPDVEGPLFACLDGKAFLRFVPPGWIELCLTEPANDIQRLGDKVGRIAEDQESAQYRSPRARASAELAGDAWQDYYRSCRDGEGRSVYDVFSFVPWTE